MKRNIPASQVKKLEVLILVFPRTQGVEPIKRLDLMELFIKNKARDVVL
jgi:hypothetical protein